MPTAVEVAEEAFDTLSADLVSPIAVGSTSGAAYALPAEAGPLYAAITKLTNADLTQGAVDGTGTFDQLMKGFKAHLRKEFEENRISGAEYTKAFIALTEGAMSNAVQYLLGRDQAYWQAITAQVGAQVAQVQLITARVNLETARAQLGLVLTQTEASKAEYALTKMKLATEQVGYDVATFNLENILPEQENLLKEQVEEQRAKTLDTRTDGVTDVAGLVGKQKDLYTQQIESYQRDAEVKAAKLFTDAWITQKTIDEGLLAPTGFANASVDEVLAAIKTNNGLD